MNHNKLNLLVGETVMLDNNYHNRSHVVIDYITPDGMFSTIHSSLCITLTEEDKWDVMTNRLTRIKTSLIWNFK